VPAESLRAGGQPDRTLLRRQAGGRLSPQAANVNASKSAASSFVLVTLVAETAGATVTAMRASSFIVTTAREHPLLLAQPGTGLASKAQS
jgi:hypothetical protein